MRDEIFDTGSGFSKKSGTVELASYVNALYPYPDGRLLVGGNFNHYKGFETGHLVRLSDQGERDEGFPVLDGSAFSGQVKFIKQYNSDYLLVGGGWLTSYAGENLPRLLIKIHKENGLRDTSMDTNFLGSSNMEAVAIDGSEKIYGLSRNNTTSFLRHNSDGSSDNGWPAFNMEPFTYVGDGERSQILIQPGDGKILLAEHFSHIRNISNFNQYSRGRLARFNTNGTLDDSFNAGSGFDERVYSLELLNEGKILVGGAFLNYGGSRGLNLLRLNEDWTPDTSFAGVEAGNLFEASPFNAMGIQSNGNIIVSGFFNYINNSNEYQLSRILPNGSVDYAFSRGFSGEGSPIIQSVRVQSDDKVLIGGGIIVYDGTGLGRIARLNSNGSLDTLFNSGGSGFDGTVTNIQIQEDGRILVGGSFTSYNGIAVKSPVRLLSNGSLDGDFESELPTSGQILKYLRSSHKIMVHNNNLLYRLLPDGSLDEAFTPFPLVGSSSSHFVEELPNGKYLVSRGGSGVVRLHPNGERDLTFFVPLKGGPGGLQVNLLIPISSTEYFLGGYFHYFNTTPVRNWIRVTEP